MLQDTGTLHSKKKLNIVDHKQKPAPWYKKGQEKAAKKIVENFNKILQINQLFKIMKFFSHSAVLIEAGTKQPA